MEKSLLVCREIALAINSAPEQCNKLLDIWRAEKNTAIIQPDIFFLVYTVIFCFFFFLDFNEAWCCWLTNLHVLQSLQASPMGAQPTSQRHQNTSAPITETPSGSMSTMHYFEKGKIGPAELVPTVCWRLIWFHKKLKITVGNWMISAHILLWHHQAGTGSALFVEDQT